MSRTVTVPAWWLVLGFALAVLVAAVALRFCTGGKSESVSGAMP